MWSGPSTAVEGMCGRVCDTGNGMDIRGGDGNVAVADETAGVLLQ